MFATIDHWNVTEYSKDIRDAAIHLNKEHSLGIELPYDVPSEYACLKACRKHWAKLRKAGIELIKEKDYPQIKQIEKLGENHWRCTNHSKASVYEITKENEQFNCTCPANTHGIYCSHIEALLESDIYQSDVVSVQAVGVASLNDALNALRTGKSLSDEKVLFAPSVKEEPATVVAPWDEEDLHHADGTEHIDWEEVYHNCPAVDKRAPELLPSPGVVQPSVSLSNLEIHPYIKGEEKTLTLPNGFTASNDQGAAFRGVWDWYQSGEQFYVVSGRAGSGKTSLLQLLIEQLPATRIAIVAPSNKAVKVVQSKITQVRGKVVQTMTLAKLLGIRPSRHSDQQVFEKDPNAESVVNQFNLVIVDECSMVGKDVFDWLLGEMNSLFSQASKCLLMGDDAQLPPVLEDVSLTFTDIKQQSRLTEVIRNDGAVLEWGVFLTEHLKDHRIIWPQTQFNEDKTKGIWVLDEKQWEDQLVRAFTAARDKGYGPDQVRALAWTNKRVNQLNHKIRAALNPRSAQFEEGDRLIVNSPFALSLFGDEPDDWLQTSDELTVVRGGIDGTLEGVPVWNVLVKTMAGTVVQVPILKLSGTGIYKQRLKEFRESKQYESFWSFKESFCDVSYAYCLDDPQKSRQYVQGCIYRWERHW